MYTKCIFHIKMNCSNAVHNFHSKAAQVAEYGNYMCACNYNYSQPEPEKNFMCNVN